MSELFASIKALIEKVNLIIFLLALAVAIFTYQVIAKEILWAAFAFCISYVLFAGIHSCFISYKENLKQKEEKRKFQEAANLRKQNEEIKIKQDKEQKEAHLRTIYASLPDEVKEGLEMLYNLPQPEGGYSNSRIFKIENTDEYQIINNAFIQIRFNLNLEYLMEAQHSIQSQIITIMPEFYSIIEENAKKGKE